jgi:two-component system, chemotaxis family, chemotaxis protein CheY
VTALQTCLIVDDSDVVRRVMRSVIEDLGFQVEDTASTEAAMLVCRKRMPDIIVLDWHIPGSHPLEFIAAVRSQPQGRDTKILFVATDNDPVEIGRAIAFGANDTLIKPFYRVGLEAKVAALTTVKRAAAQDDDYVRIAPLRTALGKR